MPYRRVNAARFIARVLPEPYETLLGGENPEAVHHLLATVFAHVHCSPSGHSVSWDDTYALAWATPLPHKADNLLDEWGTPRPIPPHITGTRLVQARAAQRIAVRLRRAARYMPLGNKG